MKKGLAVLLAVAFVLGVSGEAEIPSSEHCLETLGAAATETLQTKLAPCAFGTSEICCTNINDLIAIGVPKFGGCFCHTEVLDTMIGAIESNPLAQSFGFTGESLVEVLESCKADYDGQNGCSSD